MRAQIFGCPIDILTMSETIDLARAAMRERTTTLHVALNVAKLVNMRTDPVLEEDVKSADLIGIDGMGILLAARLLGLPAKERVAGIDLLQELLVVCANEGFRPFFLGATPSVVQKARAAVTAKHPTVDFAGIHDGYLDADREPRVVEEIRNSEADCLFIAMPTPRKERFLAAHRGQLGVPFIMGVGGSLDVLAGEVVRAPRLMQNLGLEWLYRVYQEPRRMWWRYCRTNTIFAGMMFSALTRHVGRKMLLFTNRLAIAESWRRKGSGTQAWLSITYKIFRRPKP
jgi:N-acetylglucosaminyldiphosphoundecaprenol N-acetyl-beta-D-mannosaminyltransferase